MGTNITTPDKRWRLTAPGSAGWAVVLFIIGACLLRFIYLTADPHYYGWFGHIIDEGRWTMNARSLILHDQLVPDGRTAHLVAAPLFQLVSYIAFLLLGVSHFAARLFPAICGAIFLILLTATLWRRTSMPALFLGLSVVAFQADYVVLSRVATPEIVLILFELLVFLLIVFGPKGRWRFFLAGCVTAVAIGFKATSVSLLFVFALATLAQRVPTTGGYELRGRIVDGLAYISGFIASALVVFAAATPVWMVHLSAFTGDIAYAFTNLVQLNSFYGMVRVPFHDFMSPIYNTAALGVWLGILTGLAGLHGETDGVTRRMPRVAAVWAAAYALVMLLSHYAPGRYMVHVLTPAAILIAFGISPLTRYGLTELIVRLNTGHPLRVACNIAVLTMPASIVLAPLFLDAFAIGGVSPERLRFKLMSVALPWLLVTPITYLLRRRAELLRSWIVVPVVFALGWLSVWIVAIKAPDFWPIAGWTYHFTAYALFLIALCLACTAIAKSKRIARLGAGGALVAAGLVVSAAWLVQLAPGFISPTFTVRDSSQELGALFDAEGVVSQNTAAGLFLDNDLAMHRVSRDWQETKPERLVVAFWKPNAEKIAKYYELLATRTLHVSKQFRVRYGDRETMRCVEGDCPNLFVYRRRD